MRIRNTCAHCHRAGYRLGRISRVYLCTGHYRREDRGMPMDTPIATRRPRRPSHGKCTLEYCPRTIFSNGLCCAHYHRRAKGMPNWDSQLRVERYRLGPQRKIRLPDALDQMLQRRSTAYGVSAEAIMQQILIAWGDNQRAAAHERKQMQGNNSIHGEIQ